jgi:hypothetical protein
LTINPLSVTIDSMTKITELKKAANLYTDTSGRWANADGVDRLVELIIRECMTVCQTIDKEYDGEDVLATWCATEIGKHFGVDQ